MATVAPTCRTRSWAGCTRRASRGPVQFVRRLADPPDGRARHRRTHRRTGLARRRLLRGAPTCPSSGFFALPTTVVVDHMGRPDVAARRRPRVRVASCGARPATSGPRSSCPERLTPPARRHGTASGTPTATWCRSRAGRRGVPGPGAVGHRLAPPQPQRPHARRRAAGRRRPARRRHSGAPQSCWSTTPRACTGPRDGRRTSDTRPHLPKDNLGHAAFQRREPAGPTTHRPLPQGHAGLRCRSRTSSSSPTSTASPPRHPS